MSALSDIPQREVSRHIAIIMDGNSLLERYAAGSERVRGHQQGDIGANRRH